MSLIVPQDVERLSNGNTLITDAGNNRVIEVDTDKNIVWNYTVTDYPYDAERLDNGNTLITDSGAHNLIEVDSDGNIVWNCSAKILFFDVEVLEPPSPEDDIDDLIDDIEDMLDETRKCPIIAPTTSRLIVKRKGKSITRKIPKPIILVDTREQPIF